MISLLALLLTAVIWGVIFYILWWGLGKINIAEPFKTVATVILVVAAVIVAIGLLTGSIGTFPIVSSVIK